jgi:uncharacterized protein
MAKAPAAGQTKTRLTPPLTPAQAAALSLAFVIDISHNIAAAAAHVPADGWVAYAPAGTGHAFDGWLAPGTRLILADGGINLPPRIVGIGRSLLHATRGLLARGYHAVCLVNGDSPTLPTASLVAAVSWLLEDPRQIVLGPAEDGGYYLIGMAAPYPGLFQDIEWSTPAVAAQTRARAAAAGLRVAELPPWYDVDSPVLLDRLIAELEHPGPGYPGPATAACLSRFLVK